MTAASHIPVLLNEVVLHLAPKKGGCYVDGTFGAGGYTRAILEAAECRVHAFDQDPSAIAGGQAMMRQYTGRLALHHARFGEMETVLTAANVSAVDGIVLDIGVSSMQLDDAARGFSFMKDGPLDGRMAQTGQSVADFVNDAEEAHLAEVIKVYGEERQARRIAKAITRERQSKPFTRTSQLANLIESVLGTPPKQRIHPATRTFQALRIYINNELGELVNVLAAAERLLKPAGRLLVVAFHSLEDRIVKRFFAERSGQAGNPSRHLPASEKAEAPSFKLLTRRAVKPTDEEVEANPRARSARLRAAERTLAPAFPLDVTKLGLPRGMEI